MPNARGLETNPLALIQHLRHNLIDRYPRDSISKELLQNAEDARASLVHFGWSPGLPAAHHPLLHGPALFALNNGAFSAQDAEAICQFGLNYKAVDRTSIGKFGLGLKSVFHLCEAFFYLSSTVPQENDPPEIFNSIVNPWFGTAHHGDWNEFSAVDQNLVRGHLGRLLSEPNWFCLWIPLRREAHCSGAAPIHKDFPGDLTTCPPDLLSEAAAIFLAEQLPLLRHINQISVWNDWTESSAANDPLLVASVPATASRSRFPEPLQDSVGTSGKLSIKLRGTASEMTYSLWQDWLAHLEEFRGRTAWPQSFSLAHDGQPRPEKAEPHCAVSLIRSPLNAAGRLVVSTAVFLPLRGAVKDYPCEDDADYALKLHGCFFVDAGRGGPGEAADERSDEIRLKHEWNRRLLEEGVYPLLIPAVAELAVAVSASAAAIRGFTAAVEGSDTFRDSRQHICSTWHWAYRWRPAGLSWEKTQASLTVLEIPDPGEASLNLPGEALPRLARLSETYLLTPSGWPRLSAGPAATWPAAALEAVLDADPRPLFDRGARGWAYLRRFVEAAPPTSAGREGTEALAALLRRTFAGVRTRSLRERAEDVRAVVRQLPPDRRVRVPIPANWSEADRQGFLAEPVGVVLVPAEFDPDDAPGTGRLDVEEAVRLLTVLQPPCQRSKTSGPARSILSAVHGGATAVLARCADLALWQGDLVTPDGAAQTVFSYTRLAQAHQERRLFSGTAESAPPATLLARACAALDVMLLPSDTAEALFGNGDIPLCEPPAMLAAFDAAPPLAAIDRRVALFQYLLSRFPDQTDDSTWHRAIRYLLHGRPEAIQESLPLYVGDRQGDGVWTKLARLALDDRGDGWRVIHPGCLTELLSEQHRRTLKVYGINADGVAQLLTEVRPENIEIDFSPQEQQQVIFGFREFPNLLKALPLHDGLDGKLHRIDARSYWKETWYSLEGPLGEKVRLLRPCDKEHLAAIQRPLASTLNPVEVLKLAAAESLHAYWETVLDALTKAGTLPLDLRATLASTEWLPLSGGKAAAPARVLYDPDLKDEVAAVLATAPPGSPVSPTALRADVRDHRGFAALVRHKLFPARDQLLSRLGGALHPQERYHVGPLPFSGPDAMDDWLHAFRDAPTDVMPIRDLLEHIHEVDPVLCRSHFIPNLTGDIDSGRLERVLAFLRDRHTSPTASQLSRILRVHNAYLQIAAADATGFAKLLPSLRLLSREGVWTPPTTLCAGVTGIHPAETLDPDQEDILRHQVKVQKPRELKRAISNAGPTVGYNLLSEWHTSVWQLDSYFTRWAAASEDIGGWAGAFLSLLGDFEPLRKLAEKLLPRGRSPEYIRAAAGFRERTRKGSDGSTFTESPTRILGLQRFLVEVTEPKPTIRAVNLLGEAFNARAASQTDDLLIGYGLRKLDVLLEGGLQVHWLHLRQIDPARTEPAELRRLLEGTADRILRQVYGQKDGSLRDVLTELCEGEQFGIRAAQAVLLEGAGHYLRQFGLTSPPALRDVLHQYDDAADRRAEERVAAEHGRDLEGESGEEKAERARRRLQELIETDHDVRTAILAAVRRKLGDYRYHTGSVLFELFQNADDAYVELQSNDDAVFSVATEEDSLTVMHAGRRINRLSGTGADDAGHARDLRKMLALGHSDKGIAPQGDQVTGRFGLGFKSVFLLSDQPKAVSGRLGFEVLAGVYPRPLGREPAERLRQCLHAAGFTHQDGTAFELSLRDGIAPDVALAPFCDLAHYLVMFARRVRRCVMSASDQTTREASWSDEVVTAAGGTTQVATGTLRPIAGPVLAGPRQALVIRSPHGDLMLALNAQGFTRLPANVPTVWVTAPTQERHGLGWAVNGLFTLDVGRSQVDWTAAANRDLGLQLGTVIGEGFVALFDHAENAWNNVVTQLRLAPAVTKQEFWESLWRTLSATTSGPDTLRSMIWENRKSGAARLYAERPALPTGFEGGERRLLTSLDRVEAILAGVMDAEGKSDLLSAAREFVGIRKRPLAAIVSERRVWSRLKTLSPRLAPDHPRIDLASLLADEIASQPKIDPEAATQYGRVATRTLIREMDDGPPDQKAEAMRLRENALFRAQFRTRGGTWEPARRVLLTQEADSDELQIAAFAPAERVLADPYQGVGLDFFLACRGSLLPSRPEMIVWACHASTETQQVAVLRYMLQGLYGRELAHELKGKVANTEWLANLPNSKLLDPFDTRERYILLLLLDLLSTEPQEGNGQDVRPPDQAGQFQQQLQARDFLLRLAAWWSENAAQLVARYERHTYFGGHAPDLSGNSPGDDPSERKKWLTLFLIGTFHTMGRAKAAQHRSFLGLSEREGWLDLLAQPEPDIIGWLTAVRGYINKQTNRLPFYHWFKQALGVATIASHLEAYSQAFLAVNQWRRPFALTQITVPRASEIFQGTDVDAPPLAPILGMGCCFVMRELVRLGHITVSHSHQHCFEPVERVRKLLATLGCSSLETRDGYPWEMSKVVFHFLEEHCDDPTFQGGFDLPLLLWQPKCVTLPQPPSADGDFVTLSDGRVIPRSYMR